MAAEFASDSPDVFLKAAMNIASMDFFSVLNRFDTVALSTHLNDKPELYFQLINSYANLMNASLEQQELEFRQKQEKARQRDRNEKLRARKPILITPATIGHIASSVRRNSVESSQHVVPASAGKTRETFCSPNRLKAGTAYRNCSANVCECIMRRKAVYLPE